MNNKSESNKKQIVLLNEKIKFPSLIVIDENGTNLGLMPTSKALDLANSKNLDLFVFSVQQDKVVAKILDYGKYKFDKQKKQKENKKNQATAKLKEIKVKPLIGEHDLNVRIENARKWLNSKFKVKFIIEARGRLSVKTEFIDDIYKKFSNAILEYGNIIQANVKVNQFRYETLIDPK